LATRSFPESRNHCRYCVSLLLVTALALPSVRSARTRANACKAYSSCSKNTDASCGKTNCERRRGVMSYAFGIEDTQVHVVLLTLPCKVIAPRHRLPDCVKGRALLKHSAVSPASTKTPGPSISVRRLGGANDGGHLNTTVRVPFRRMRCSACHFTARASTAHSTSRPTSAKSSTLIAWFTRSTSCSMIGPSSSASVT
jgi:hypothetical protein